MAEPEVFAVPSADAEPEAAPHVSLVVPIYNEQASVDELYRRTIDDARVDGRTFELIFVDDGSTDGTFAMLERLHDADPRVRVVRFKRNFGQHPAMHAGLARARGEIVVTMDGDLQNHPRTSRSSSRAVEAGADVASGRRAARHDSWGRTLPSRMINGMLRRFTRVDISDFGCAFNAYRRDAVEPMLGAIGKQKFTKALILSGRRERRRGRRRARAARRTVALLAASPDRGSRCTCSPVSGRSRSSGSGSRSASSARSWRWRSAIYGVWCWIDRANFPGPLLGGVAVLFVLGIQGFILALVGEYLGRIQRDVERPAALHDRPRALERRGSTAGKLEARPRHRRRRVHLRRTSSATCSRDTVRGRLARRAHVRGQPREPGRRAWRTSGSRSSTATSATPTSSRERRRRRRRDRQRRRRVARREVDRGGRLASS